MSADLMSFSIFLFLTGTENIFVWFGRVYFCLPSLLSFPTSHSSPLLSKHSKPRTAAEPCPPRRSPSCSVTPGLITQELWAGSGDTKIHPLGWAASQKQDAFGTKRHLPLQITLCRTFSLCPRRGASLKELWLKKGEVPTMMLVPGEGCLSALATLLLCRQVSQHDISRDILLPKARWHHPFFLLVPGSGYTPNLAQVLTVSASWSVLAVCQPTSVTKQ